MKIAELLHEENVVAEIGARNKGDALSELAGKMVELHPKLNHDDLMKTLLERERLGSTGIGDGVAISHGKLPEMKELALVFGRSRTGVEFDSMDGKPVHLIFLLVAPEESVGEHLKVLARISKLLKNPETRQKLLDAPGPAEICATVASEEAKL